MGTVSIASAVHRAISLSWSSVAAALTGMPFVKRLMDRWATFTLAQQYAWAGSLVLLLGMVTIGSWVYEKIRHGVVQNSAAATALYMDSIIAPRIQELENAQLLSTSTSTKVDGILQGTSLSESVVSAKIWQMGGRVVYATDKSLIGKQFTPTVNLRNAWRGIVSAEFDSLHDDEDTSEQAMGLPLLEMYVPIRKEGTELVIAVAEFYLTGEKIRDALNEAFRDTWLMVGLTSLIMLGTLYGIVRNGSSIIEAQRNSLKLQIAQLTALLTQNENLRLKVQRASRRTTELNERFLRKIGADLHDGPAQLIGLALLRLNEPDHHAASRVDDSVDDRLRAVLSDALTEIRNISGGLATPELIATNINDALMIAIRNHETRTETFVKFDLQKYSGTIPNDVVVCAYRFVQEALNNAFRHAGGKGQTVHARYDDQRIELKVCDEGPGFDLGEADTGIGLVALRDRVMSLGGEFNITNRPSGGICVTFQISNRKPDIFDD